VFSLQWQDASKPAGNSKITGCSFCHLPQRDCCTEYPGECSLSMRQSFSARGYGNWNLYNIQACGVSNCL